MTGATRKIWQNLKKKICLMNQKTLKIWGIFKARPGEEKNKIIKTF